MDTFKQTCLVALLFSLQATAQENEANAPNDPAPTDIEATDAQAVERESLELSVPSTVLAQDVKRRATSGGAVMDEMELGRTQITGNQELPKVMYIVPWKKSDPGDLMGKPVNTLLDEVLAPLDREEFMRQVDYYDDLYGEVEE